MKMPRFRSGSVVLLFSALVLTVQAAPSNPEHIARLRKTHECQGCDLTKADLAGFQGAGAKLQNANLTDATLYGANLRDADLTGAVLDGTNLEMVDMSGAVGAILTNAKTDKRTTCPDKTAGPCR